MQSSIPVIIFCYHSTRLSSTLLIIIIIIIIIPLKIIKWDDTTEIQANLATSAKSCALPSLGHLVFS